VRRGNNDLDVKPKFWRDIDDDGEKRQDSGPSRHWKPDLRHE